MDTLFQLLISLLLGGLGFIIVAKVVPNFRIYGGFGTAVFIGLVYGILKMILQWVLIFLSFPFVILTLGLFIVVINAFLLWLTDKLVSKFEVRTFGSLFAGTILLSLIDWGYQLLLRQGALY